MKKTILSLLATSALAANSIACGGYGIELELALDGTDQEIAALAKFYRSQGEPGLRQVLAAERTMGAHPKYASFVDQVAKQRGATKSQLFWHTDFDQALAIAQQTKRPVLSLRLLGNLDDEFSCANSRLFREVLYSDSAVSSHLRNNYVLHWKSVRPVPVMTIDFGDGRTLKRTITGNSVHYVTDSRGRVFDAFPGLYTTEKFLQSLKVAADFNAAHGDDCSRSRPRSLHAYHKNGLATTKAIFAGRLEMCGLSEKRIGDPIEMTDFSTAEWALIAATKPKPAQKQMLAVRANALTAAKCVSEEVLIERVAESELEIKRRANLKKSTAEDSARNEFVFHRRVREALLAGAQSTEIEALNRWVYTELFEMPDNDPWLGLHTPEHFTGLTDNGAR